MAGLLPAVCNRGCGGLEMLCVAAAGLIRSCSLSPRSVRDRRPVTLRAIAAQEVSMAVEVHHRIGDRLRAVVKIEIVQLAALGVAVHPVGPEPEHDIGMLAAHVIFEKPGGACAIEDRAVQEIATFGFESVLLRLRTAGNGSDHRHRDQTRNQAASVATHWLLRLWRSRASRTFPCTLSQSVASGARDSRCKPGALRPVAPSTWPAGRAPAKAMMARATEKIEATTALAFSQRSNATRSAQDSSR